MWWVLVACGVDEVGRGVQSAEAVACLDAPDASIALPVTVEGAALADGAPDGTETWDVGARCESVARRLELVDADRRVWRVGYGWLEGGAPATSPLAIGPESELVLDFHAEAEHAGFVLTELDRLVAAVAVGIGDPGLPAGAVTGLDVRDGPSTGSEPTDCGDRVARRIVFDGDGEPIELEPVDADWMRVDGVEVRAWALAAWGMRDAHLDDAAGTCPRDGELSWALWRED